MTHGPDFAGLYPFEFDEEGYRVGLSPRMAFHLWSAAQYWIDMASDNRELLLDELPPTARRHANDVWLDRFLQSFRNVRDRIAEGNAWETVIAQCTADELVVHLITTRVEAAIEDGWLVQPEDVGVQLPHFDEDDDAAWVSEQRELLLEDYDVLELFDPAKDGVEEADDPVAEQLGFANLRGDRWFLPFRDQGDA
jgi:hypothetical protein